MGHRVLNNMNLGFERKIVRRGFEHVLGCDEVGRGSLAGPVVAAAVILDLGRPVADLAKVRDSKRLAPKQREVLSRVIKERAVAWAFGEVAPQLVDEMNIHQATLLALKIAAEKVLAAVPSGTTYICVDGKFKIPGMAAEQAAIVKGDDKILSVAAASILAKTYRDSLMRESSGRFPEYGFAQHKGYGTLHHRRAIKIFGLSPLHRRTFCSHLL